MTSPFDELRSMGTGLVQQIQPTLQLYGPLLVKNEKAIRATKRTTHKYGPHERQELDVYYPTKPHTRNGRRPVLIFLYGGGLVNGAKQIPSFANGLAHANVGHYFAEKFGFLTVIVDYRLMSHGAKFPSGGEDLSLAVDWICADGLGAEAPLDLFIMGNSAGGVHTCQFLFCDEFGATRAKISSGTDSHRLRGVVLLGAPGSFDNADETSIKTVLEPFFGDHIKNSAVGQIKTMQEEKKQPDFIKGSNVRLLLLTSELDPVDQIINPTHEFMRRWLDFPDAQVGLALCADRIAKHNHISPIFGLGTGIPEQEQWGMHIGAFVHSGIAFPPT